MYDFCHFDGQILQCVVNESYLMNTTRSAWKVFDLHGVVIGDNRGFIEFYEQDTKKKKVNISAGTF